VGIENPMVVLNSTDGITSDPRVRQALNMAIDRVALADQLFGGYAEPSRCQPVAPQALGYNDSLEPYPYDPDAASALIQEAGVEGETVSFVTSDVFTKGREMSEVIASYWREIGLDVDMDLPDFDTYLEHLYAKGPDHPAAVYVSSSTDLLEAAAASRQLTTEGIQSAYSNPEVDGLYEQALETVDSDERDATYSEALSIACEDAALVNLLHVEDIYGTSERLQWEPRFDGAVYGPLFHDMSVSE
jgi:peptide/nickel transport system substrate-binding protein